MSDMCFYYKREDGDLTVVGVYVDDLLVTATNHTAVERLFMAMAPLSIRILGQCRNFWEFE